MGEITKGAKRVEPPSDEAVSTVRAGNGGHLPLSIVIDRIISYGCSKVERWKEGKGSEKSRNLHDMNDARVLLSERTA